MFVFRAFLHCMYVCIALIPIYGKQHPYSLRIVAICKNPFPHPTLSLIKKSLFILILRKDKVFILDVYSWQLVDEVR